jgi:hypothetical protein
MVRSLLLLTPSFERYLPVLKLYLRRSQIRILNALKSAKFAATRVGIKNPPKKPTLKNPLKMDFLGFLGFFKFLIFYENNTNFSLSN